MFVAVFTSGKRITNWYSCHKRRFNAVACIKSNVFNECIGAGRANEGLQADWQKQLAMIQKDIPFKYIRFHGLLHDDMRVYPVILLN